MNDDPQSQLMAALADAIIQASPPNPANPEERQVTMEHAVGALMGLAALIVEAEPTVTDWNIDVVAREFGARFGEGILKARLLYKKTGRRIWDGRSTRPN